MVKRWVLMLLILILGFGYGNVHWVLAADLDEIYIRLDRTKAGVSPGRVLIVSKTGSPEVESGVKVEIGSAWSISSNLNDFEISTVDLPSGVTAWPGIETASQVSGNTLIFPSNDLNTEVNYGFYLAGGIGINPIVGNGPNYYWRISTLTDSGEDRSQQFELRVVANDQITVTGVIPANASDYQAAISSDLIGKAGQNQTIHYELTYGSYSLISTKPLIITAEWSRGTIDGFPVPSLDIVDYILDSGTTGFGGAEPVVDLVNQRITWTISNFPSETINQVVSFDLKTNESYIGSKDVNFDVSLIMVAGGTPVAEKVVNQTYHYVNLTPSPTQTPLPTATPTLVTSAPTTIPVSTPSTPGPTSTPISTSTSVPTPTSVPVKEVTIEKVEVTEISQSTIGIRISTNQVPARLTISYGKSMFSLNKKVVTLDRLVKHTISLDSLDSDTDYYFRITAEDENNNLYRSNLFIFKTAAESTGPRVLASSVLIISQRKVLYKAESGLLNNDKVLVIIPKNQEYTVEFKISGQEKIKNVAMIIRESQVLGISSAYGLEPSEYAVDLVQVRDEEYMGYLKSSPKTSFYDMVARVIDFKGNVVEEKIVTLEVISPLTVYDKKTGKPIEAAKVLLSIFNQQANRYETVSPSSLAIQNPSYSEPNGEVPLVLSEGKYKAEINAEEYQATEVEFAIQAGGDQLYPKVYLLPKPATLATKLKFYSATIGDLLNFQENNWHQLIGSTRFFRLTSKINLAITVLFLCLIPRYKKKKVNKKSALLVKTWLLMEVLELSLGILVILMTGLNLIFILNYGIFVAGLWFGLGVINLIWWLIYTYERDKKMVNSH